MRQLLLQSIDYTYLQGFFRGQKTLLSYWPDRLPVNPILCLERSARIAMWVRFGRKPVGLAIFRITDEEVARVSPAISDQVMGILCYLWLSYKQ